jgi:ceramide glucosyltransferase
LNTTFVPSAAVASRLSGVRYCFGASLALRRRDLEEAGGYAGIGDHLADDYEVGRRMTDLGRRVVLSDYVVSQQLGSGSAVASWDRELRWARGLRASNPSVYPGMLLTYSTPLALLVLALSPWTVFGGWQLGAALLATTLLLRWFVAAAALRALGRPQPIRDLIWLPARDLLTGIVWFCGLAGNHVAWRGRRYVLLPDGRLSRL